MEINMFRVEMEVFSKLIEFQLISCILFMGCFVEIKMLFNVSKDTFN